MNTEATITGGTLATLIVVPFLLALLALLGGLALRLIRRFGATSQEDRVLGRVMVGCCVFLALLILVATWWGMYPWHWEYHEWRPVSGTVSTVDSRLNRSDGGMEDKFVVTFEGDRQQYGVLDTRVATLRPGDHLEITCVRRWQWSGTHGYDCNFVDMERPR